MIELTVSRKRLSSYSLDDDTAQSKNIKYNGVHITKLPPELIAKFFSYLDNLNDLSACMCVNLRWREIIVKHHVRPFYRSCHPLEPFPYQQEKAVEHYNSSIRNWLNRFSNEGKRLVKQLDDLTERSYFADTLFFSIAATLTSAKSFLCNIRFTYTHDGPVWNVSFSPNVKSFVAASNDGTARNCGLKGYSESIIHHGFMTQVKNASFSPNGDYVVTASADKTAKVSRVVDWKCGPKTSLLHSGRVNNASFSPDSKHIITASKDKTAKIWGLVDGEWKEEDSLIHADEVHNASFSPDGKHVVTASEDKTAKIWGLVDGQWQEKGILRHSGRVNNAIFSPRRHTRCDSLT